MEPTLHLTIQSQLLKILIKIYGQKTQDTHNKRSWKSFRILANQKSNFDPTESEMVWTMV